MKASNEKLQDRAARILMDETGIDRCTAEKLLEDAGGDLRVALVMQETGLDRDKSAEFLKQSDFSIKDAIAKAGR